ncbi:hypothetical protein [Sphingobacterium sp. BIGb0116]|nr:hypothetical protein [Sphingobacterium sp. BIGb0116]MCS4164410.1 hypothetical protein [Sphingobacterium sp. BIGb0116]
MEAIIKALKKYPNKDVYKIARLLKVDTMDVSHAQHEYLKRFRKD